MLFSLDFDSFFNAYLDLLVLRLSVGFVYFSHLKRFYLTVEYMMFLASFCTKYYSYFLLYSAILGFC